MSFGSPLLLFSLLAVPVAVIAYLLLERRRSARAAAWSNPSLLPNLVSSRASRLRHVPVFFFLLALTFLLVGFARPQEHLGHSRQGAATVVLAFDVSGSMAANDLGRRRIDAARSVAAKLVRALPQNDRIGIVTFGENVHLVQAPTLDRARVLDGLPTKVTPRAGTRIGDGIDDAVSVVIEAVGKSYPGSPVHPGAVVVLSDGAQTAGGPTPAQAANTAYLDGVPIDSVALGTSKGEVAQTVKVGDRTVPTTIDVPVYASDLHAASHLTGGSAYEVTSAADIVPVAAGLGRSYRRLAATVLPDERERPLSAPTAAIALGLVVIAVVLSATWFGRAG